MQVDNHSWSTHDILGTKGYTPGYDEKVTAFVIGINLSLTPESATRVILNKLLHLSRF